jgi:hypothetical protein
VPQAHTHAVRYSQNYPRESNPHQQANQNKGGALRATESVQGTTRTAAFWHSNCTAAGTTTSPLAGHLTAATPTDNQLTAALIAVTGHNHPPTVCQKINAGGCFGHFHILLAGSADG